MNTLGLVKCTYRTCSMLLTILAAARAAQKTSLPLLRVFAGETTCPQICSLATAVVFSLVYTAVTWQWVYMSLCVHKAKVPICKVHPLCEPGYVISCVGNLTEEKSCVSIF
jgi:hypothetical protein